MDSLMLGIARKRMEPSIATTRTGPSVATRPHHDLARARAHLDAADEHIRQAHAEHTGIIQLEAGGRTLPYAALFSHAQDTLMTTYSELRLARRLLPVFRTLDDRIRALEAKSHD